MKKIAAAKLRDQLAYVGVHGDRQLFTAVETMPPVIVYRLSNRHAYPRWLVTRPGYKTDPTYGHFLDGHNKAFVVKRRDDKKPQLELAIDWASKKYSFTLDEWVKTPYGSWAPRAVLETALRHHLPHLFGESGSTVTPIESTGATETALYSHVSAPPVDAPAEAVEPPGQDTDGWYRVLGANVAVFVQATNADDARGRVEHMINHTLTDVTPTLHVRPARDEELT
jgi:hypothetical protein